MFARLIMHQVDPQKIDAAIEYVDGRAREAVEATEGNRGFAVLADLEGGRVLGASYWESAESMRASEEKLADLRASAAETLGREMSIERFELALGFRHTIPGRGALVRMARFEMEPSRVEEVISVVREENVPSVKGAPGLCSFQLLLDREAGSGMVVTAWEDQAAADAFWPTAQQLRARLSERVGAAFGGVENLTLIRTTLQLD